MKLTPELKKLIFQQVHCTGYLSKSHGNYLLTHNRYDNKWYFHSNLLHGDYVGIGTDNISSWKHNRKYELKEKEFSGIVVKIDRVLISTMLGAFKRDCFSHDYFYPCDFAPTKKDGCAVIAATVYFNANA